MPDVAEPDLIGDDQPEVYDLICVGTGLGETMLAACVPPRASPPRHPPRVASAPVASFLPTRRPSRAHPFLPPSPPILHPQVRGEGG